MTGLEIFSLVEEKKKKIEDLIDPTTFVLNHEVVELQTIVWAIFIGVKFGIKI